MGTQYRCKLENRRALVKTTVDKTTHKPILNGLDYLEVSPADQKVLILHFIHPLPGRPGGVPDDSTLALTRDHFVIRGGVRIRNVRVVRVAPAEETPEPADNQLALTVNQAGDFSTYTLSLVQPQVDRPPTGFDPQLSEVEFRFKVTCPSDFDCKVTQECPPVKLSAPEFSYLAKDYASFRRLMLDRLSVLMPDWHERNPVDVQMALVEMLAYLGDHLSYYQDAVATEAYLGTARKRISMRRHARLLDYPMHDGCNARVWVAFEVDAGADGTILPGPDPALQQPGTLLLSRVNAPPGPLPAAKLDDALLQGPEVFETLHDLTLYAEHNTLHFYTWSDHRCCLPRGATRATLKGRHERLEPGDVLIFEERRSPTTGEPGDADPGHRHAVRLTRVANRDEEDKPLHDPLHGQSVTAIEWGLEDALPFPLCISAQTDAAHGAKDIPEVSVALGNVVLADHGRTIPRSELHEEAEELSPVVAGSAYRPVLRWSPLTQQKQVRELRPDPATGLQRWTGKLLSVDDQAAAATAFQGAMRDVRPAVRLLEEGSEPWLSQRDLLACDRFDRYFVVEVEEDGRAHLRFGDDVMGRRPEQNTVLKAMYRFGNGTAGNVGPEAIAHVVTGVTGILSLRNPLPARGGVDPEKLEQVRQYAPQAFRTQERAVTEADWADVAQRHPEVQKAAATIRWTGSWYTVFVTMDRRGGLEVDLPFEQELRDHLEPYRIAGYDLEVNGPSFVPLDIRLRVCVRPGYYRTRVKDTLLERFSNRESAAGVRGFFHPDNFTFADPVYLSRLYQTAMAVEGVETVQVLRFQRWGKEANHELQNRLLATGPLEVVRLDNDPNFPENGKMELEIEGGL